MNLSARPLSPAQDSFLTEQSVMNDDRKTIFKITNYATDTKPLPIKLAAKLISQRPVRCKDEQSSDIKLTKFKYTHSDTYTDQEVHDLNKVACELLSSLKRNE